MDSCPKHLLLHLLRPPGDAEECLVSIQQQEDQDQQWKSCLGTQVPAWRPQRFLSTHHRLLGTMVESRLMEVMKAMKEEPGGPGRLSSPLKREVSSLLKEVFGGSCAGVGHICAGV